MSKKKNIQSRWTVVIIILLVLLGLFLFFRPVLHAPTDESKMEKNLQNGKVQQTQTAKIEVLQPQKSQ